MGHLGDFDETHRTGSTQDGLHADAAHASLATLHRILLLPQTRTSVLLRVLPPRSVLTCAGGHPTHSTLALAPCSTLLLL